MTKTPHFIKNILILKEHPHTIKLLFKKILIEVPNYNATIILSVDKIYNK